MRAGLLLLVLATANVSPATIPALHGRSFADAPVELPADLHGKVGILVLGLSRNSSMQTKLWNEALLRDFGNDPKIAYFESAVLADVPGFIRGTVVNGIRNKMPEAERVHFVPILQDASQWKSAADYASPDDAYVLLLDSAGVIQRRTHGPPTGESYRSLKESLQTLEAGLHRGG